MEAEAKVMRNQSPEQVRKPSPPDCSEGAASPSTTSPSRAGREKISVLSSPPVCGNLLWWPQALNAEGCWERRLRTSPNPARKSLFFS